MVLLAAGADPNARAEDGYTPLHRAAQFGTAEAVMALLEAGADLAVRTRSLHPDTRLHPATFGGAALDCRDGNGAAGGGRGSGSASRWLSDAAVLCKDC